MEEEQPLVGQNRYVLFSIRKWDTIETPTWNSVGSGDAVGAALVGGAGDGDDAGDVGRQFGEERNLDGGADPATDVAHHFGILSAGQAHSALAHAVRTRQVQFQGVGSGRFRHFGQFRPVGLLIAAHDAGNQYLRSRFDKKNVQSILLS